MSLFDFIEREEEKLKKKAVERLGGEILRVEPGLLYIVEIMPNIEIKTINTKHGERVVIPLIYENKNYVLLLNPYGKTYRQLIKSLSDAVKSVKHREYIEKIVCNLQKTSKYSYKITCSPVLRREI